MKEEGIKILQQLSGKIWTDFNEHDPGLTILENVCFALTELGYKTNFTIEDLFFNDKNDDSNFLSTFYNPQDVLPFSPVTEKDYRKVIIDHVREVKNAWVISKSISDTGSKIDGLYEVLLMVDPDETNHDQIIASVRDILSMNRNLCEDFENIRILEPVEINIKLDLVIKPNIVGESVYANILNELLEFFSPQITLYNIDELKDLGFKQEEIYDNPMMANGFILDEDLENSELIKVSKIFRSKLIKIVSEIEGVEQVTNFEIKVDGDEIRTELIQLEEYTIPNLNVEKIFEEEAISLFAADIIYTPDYDVVRYTLETLKSKSSLTHKRFLDYGQKEYSSNKNKDEIEFYYSIQNTFPRNYGITSYGLPGKITDQRRAQVRQLQGYLFFFEQIMANYLSQLVNVNKLFSTEKDLDHTYFYQNLDYLNGYDELVSGNGEFKTILKELIDSFDKKEHRRNKFLDHMLARYGEEFLSEAFMAIHRESSSYAKDEFIEKTISSKLRYLNDYISISRDRSKGYNYLQDYTESENTSGLKKKISLFFNIDNFGYKSLSNIKQSKSVSITHGKKKANSSLSKSFKFSTNNKNILAEILGYGVDRNNYLIEQDPRQSTAFFVNPRSKEKIEIFRTKSISELEDAITKLIELIRDLNKDSEGFHLVEHILLRPISITHKVSYYSTNNISITSKDDYSNVKTSLANFRELLQTYGSIRKNYKIVEKDKVYTLQLFNDKNKLIAFNNSFILKKSAEEAVNEFFNEFKKLKTNNQEMEDNMVIEQTLSQFQTYDQDPFSLQLSIVLPRWNGRFASDKMKYLFENIVKLNAPAHLKMNYAWLNYEEMFEFEKHYEKWLKMKNKMNAKQPDLDNLSNLIQLLLLSYQFPEDKKLSKEISSLSSLVKG